MATIHFEMPDEVVQALALTEAEFARALRLTAAMEWYAQAKVSMGTAAAVAGLDLRGFLTALADHGRDMFVMDIDDVRHDLDVLARRSMREIAGD